MKRAALIATVVGVVTTAVGAQGERAFDVISVKPNSSGSLQRNFNDAEGGHFAAVNVALGDLIRVAHEVRPAGQAYSDLMNAGVPWLYSDHFDIKATTGTQPTRAQLLAMIRAMLTDRFHLRVHTVAHEEPVFELRRLREGSTPGPGLTPTSVVCDGPTAQCAISNVPGKIAATSVPIDTLAHMLSGWLDGHYEIRDRTGLNGRFTVDLNWTQNQTAMQRPDGVSARPIDSDGAPLVTAIRDQLGLQLVRTTLSVPILVVDSADRPSPD